MPTMLPKDVSLQTWTLRNHFLHSSDRYSSKFNMGLLEKVREMGYQGVEVSARGHTPIDQFLSLVKSARLKCVGVHLPCLVGINDKIAYEVVSKYVTAIETSGIKSFDDSNPILTFMGNPEKMRGSEQEYQNLISTISRATRNANGYQIGYHLYDYDLKAGEECLKRIIDSPVWLVLDTFYLRRSRMSWNDLLQRYVDQVIAAHLNDTDDRNCQASLGDGIENWNAIFSFLGQFKNCKNMVIEHDAYSDEGIGMAQRSAEYLHSNAELFGTFWKNRRVSI